MCTECPREGQSLILGKSLLLLITVGFSVTKGNARYLCDKKKIDKKKEGKKKTM